MARRRRSHVPCAIRDGGIHKNNVEAVKSRVEITMEALMEKAPEKSGFLCNP